ncbi:MAG TPA: hypothetical protein VNT52_16020 [Acidimicrobiales bacterium]|nr:hypothetical protein [Acidimicrobiales bacterium]
MGRQSPLRTGIYKVETADTGDRLGRRDAARDGRAAAMLRRRQLAQGKQALNGGGDRATAAAGAGAPAFIVLRGGAR